jgi:hypothetical protein
MNTRPLRPTMLALTAVAVALALSCGGGSGPSSSTPVTTLPAATPPPASGDGNVTQSCKLGNGSASAECSKQSSRLADKVLAAMDLLVQQKPQLFDLKDEAAPAGSGNYKVVDKQGFLAGLVANLTAAGLCAQRDPDDYNYEQIQVKNENGFSENFDVVTGAGYLWHNGYSYRGTCVPAAFPIERGDAPPPGSGCGMPYPAPIHHFNSKVHIPGGEYDILDSTAIVGPDAAYCAEIGYTDGRAWCPVRPEGSPERVPCETWRVGYAKDTGRPGPTWTLNGHYCTGRDSGCENHETNQYGLKAYVAGTYVMCGQSGACGQVVVER